MILIGQYDSPFVRRVAIAMALYGMAWEHRSWSVFGDADALARINPLTRVPTLVLGDDDDGPNGGEVLVDSAAILDHLDETAGPDRALIPRAGPGRRQALKVAALATGFADKAVALVYERVLHPEASALWIRRCTGQISGVLAALEADRAARPAPWWFGARIGHADIAVACALRFTGEAHPADFGPPALAERFPALAAHAARCEALAPFQAICQPFSPPS